MCGRYTLTAEAKQIKQEFKIEENITKALTPRYNIAPSQMIPAIVESDGVRVLSELKWGLIPSWAKDDSIGSKMINARSETLSEKPSFKNAFVHRRCIIPASGFYEWQRQSTGAKQPFYFYLKEKDVFGLAGLWERWTDKETGELIESCAIITTEANEVLRPVHDRMPVILDEADYGIWLDAEIDETDHLEKLLVPFPAAKMNSHQVSRAVNSPAANAPELIENSQ